MIVYKAISMWQPWASLWLSPAKKHETRHWATKHRGLLLVHAAKKLVSDCGEELDSIVCDKFGPYWRSVLPRGAIIGAVTLTDVLPTKAVFANRGDLTDEEEDDIECGNWEDGRLAWRRGNYWRFEPIPYRGHQSIFEVPQHVIAHQFATAEEKVR